MREGQRVIDADCHVMEPADLWLRRIEPSFRDRAPKRPDGAGDTWGQMVVDGVPMYRNYPAELVNSFEHNVSRDYGEYVKAQFDADSYIKALDRQGIDVAYLFPSLALGAVAIEGQDPQLTDAICVAYNNWIVEFASCSPTRLKPVALLSLNDPARAECELRRVVRGYGVTGVVLRPNPVAGRPPGHLDHTRFWEACAELDVAVAFHESCHASLPAAGSDRFTSHFAMHTFCHPVEQMMAFVSLVEGGVFERHPSLRVAFLEAGCGWVPYLLWRLDHLEYPNWKRQIPSLKRQPSEYFKRQCFVCVEGCEPYIDVLLDYIGVDRLLFASDFPHPDHRFGEELAEVFGSHLSPDDRGLVLWDNPRSFYGLGQGSLTAAP